MKTKFAIIGGGVAGLCCAIRLAELGEEPLLIEGGSYPSHKICGEFLSPECIHHLENWNIHPVCIPQAILYTPARRLVFPFPSPAGGLSHIQLDPLLAHHASVCGVKIMTNTQVSSFQPKKHSKDGHLIVLSNHESIEALNVIIAAGRFPPLASKAPLMQYRGFKAHFENIPIEANILHMFSLRGAYLGISSIEDNKFNVACLADVNEVKHTDPHQFIQSLAAQNPSLHFLLSQGKNLFDDWMMASTPAFGIKHTPCWPDAYFIGDAAITIPPASGNGLSMAIFGGRLAAEYSIRQQPREFKAMWNERCSSQLFWAKLLHKLMLNPSYSDPLISLAGHFPFIAKKLFELTRQPSQNEL